MPKKTLPPFYYAARAALAIRDRIRTRGARRRTGSAGCSALMDAADVVGPDL